MTSGQADVLDQKRLQQIHNECKAYFIPGPSGGMSQMFCCSRCGIEFTIPGPVGAFPVTVSRFDKKRVLQIYGVKVK